MRERERVSDWLTSERVSPAGIGTSVYAGLAGRGRIHAIFPNLLNPLLCAGTTQPRLITRLGAFLPFRLAFREGLGCHGTPPGATAK